MKTAIVIGILFCLLLSSCTDTCTGKADVSYTFTADEELQIQDLLDQAKEQRNDVELLAGYADNDKVFDHDGNTGVTAFMEDVDYGINIFEEFLDEGHVFGFYHEDDLDEAEAAGFYTSDLFCHDAIGLNLDYLATGGLSPDVLVHEGIHDIPLSHSDEVMAIIDSHDDMMTDDIWPQVIADHDSAFLSNFFYDLIEEIYAHPEWICSGRYFMIVGLVEEGTMTTEEALESLEEDYSYYNSLDCSTSSEGSWIYTRAVSIYDLDDSETLDLFGITQEDLEAFIYDAGYCQDWKTICQEYITEAEAEISASEE